ncbi:GGDEF domain-containing protein [Lysobacter sp. CAU 1642]|uniref:diguanylate cyclase n=2 Tax=Pseudomarimonas salicorniae TaxID=2933270 RepID=A0ABT0GN46_9GAMM|nr:GGDEF domain-containing protein [Lysobacter sp. CAU 1642]
MANRRQFLIWLGEVLSARDAGRPGGSWQVAMLDLDHFKRINDRYGHLVGDELLRHVAGELERQLGEGARAARFGGEEFAVLFENTGLDEAVARLDRLRRRLGESPMKLGSEQIPCDFSAGVCSVGDEDRHAVDLLRRVDSLLYEAKEAGRGRVLQPGWRERRGRAPA